MTKHRRNDTRGVVEAVRVDRELMRLAATRAVLKLCLPPEGSPPPLNAIDIKVGESLLCTSDFHATCEQLGMPAPTVMEAIRRILW